MKVSELIKRLQLLDQDKEIWIDYDTISAVEPIPINSDLLINTNYGYNNCYVIIADSQIQEEDIDDYRKYRNDEWYKDNLWDIKEIVFKENERQENLLYKKN